MLEPVLDTGSCRRAEYGGGAAESREVSIHVYYPTREEQCSPGTEKMKALTFRLLLLANLAPKLLNVRKRSSPDLW